jgi:hypothetical protein
MRVVRMIKCVESKCKYAVRAEQEREVNGSASERHNFMYKTLTFDSNRTQDTNDVLGYHHSCDHNRLSYTWKEVQSMTIVNLNATNSSTLFL